MRRRRGPAVETIHQYLVALDALAFLKDVAILALPADGRGCADGQGAEIAIFNFRLAVVADLVQSLVLVDLAVLALAVYHRVSALTHGAGEVAANLIGHILALRLVVVDRGLVALLLVEILRVRSAVHAVSQNSVAGQALSVVLVVLRVGVNYVARLACCAVEFVVEVAAAQAVGHKGRALLASTVSRQIEAVLAAEALEYIV